MRKKTVQTSSTKSSTKGNAKSNTKSNARNSVKSSVKSSAKNSPQKAVKNVAPTVENVSVKQVFRSHLLNRMNRTFQRDSLIWDREEV